MSENNENEIITSETETSADEKITPAEETPAPAAVDKTQTETEKVTDAALTRSILVSVFGILLCMVSLFSLTWAWYSSTVEVGTNRITSATFDVNVTVKEQGTEEAVQKNEEGLYILDPAKTYAVTVAKAGTAKKGFCQVAVSPTADGAATPYYTGEVPYKTENAENDYTFTVIGVAKMKFTPMWGLSPAEPGKTDVAYGGLLKLEAVTAAKSTDGQNTTDAGEDLPAETTAAVEEPEVTEEPVIPKEIDPADITTAVTEPEPQPEETTAAEPETTEAPAEVTQAPEETQTP